MNEIPEELQAEVAALADGTLAPARRAQLLSELERSPALAAALEQQRRALAMLASAADAQAPASLRFTIERQATTGMEAGARSSVENRRRLWRSQRPSSAHPPRSLRARIAAGAAVALAGLGIALSFALTGGGPTFVQAVALTQRVGGAHPLRAASGNTRAGRTLDVAIDGIRFPNWQHRFGWRAIGTRSVQLSGRRATAVYYTYEGVRPLRVGYTILAGAALPSRGGEVVLRHGVRYRLARVGGVPSVTWLRRGHTCVIAGRDVGSATLLELASASA